MATSDPIKTIDKDGKPGRPATVRRTAEKLISLKVYLQLVESGLIAPGMPKKSIAGVTKRIAGDILDALADSDLHVIPGRVARELILLVGRGAIKSDEQISPNPETGILRSGDLPTTNGETAPPDAGVQRTERVERPDEDSGRGREEASEVA